MSQESAVYKICSCLETLIDGKKADAFTVSSASSKKEALFNELKKNVHLAFEKIEKYDEVKLAVKRYVQPCYRSKCKSCDYLTFLELCLILLKLLNAALVAEENEQNASQNKKTSVPKGLLSISQQKILRKCLQFVVALGILPNLLRGIGIPLSKRLEYSKVLEHFVSEATPHQKHIQIYVCLDTLLKCMQRDALQSIILSYHATDLLAALFQLCHAPIRKVDESEIYPPNFPQPLPRDFAVRLPLMRDNSPYTDPQMSCEMLDDRNYFLPELEKFLKHLCPSILMWELLLFQGIPVKIDDSEFTIAKVPLWLRKICSQMLTDLILQNHGVASFVQVVLDKAFDVDVHNGVVDTVRMDAVARLITYNPVRHVSVEDYIHRLSKQVFDMLHVKGSHLEAVLNYVASCIVLQFCERDMKSAEQYILDVLFKPLWMCVSKTGDSKVVVKEKELTSCIEDIYKIYLSGNALLSRKFTKLLWPFFHCLCSLYFFLLEGMSYLRSRVKSILLVALNNASEEDALSLLHVATFSNNKRASVYLTTVDFAYGEEGGVGAVQQKEPDFSDVDTHCHAILELLTELKNKNLNRAYILLILKEFCTFQKITKEGADVEEILKYRFLFTAVLQELSEWDVDIGETLLSNVSQVIDLLVMLLESVCDCEDVTVLFGEETIMMVLMVLNSLIENDNQLTSDDWTFLRKCIPSLQKLRKSNIDSCLKQMVFSILTHIATHGATCKGTTYAAAMKDYLVNSSELSGATSKVKSKVKSDNTDNPLVEDITEKTGENQESQMPQTSHLEEAPMSVESENSGSQSIKNCQESLTDVQLDFHVLCESSKLSSTHTPFQMAMRDLQDASVPVRGHGLIALGRLLYQRDKETLLHKTELLMVFQEHLEDEDSYVYLSAIQGLSFLADIDAELVLPAILNNFQKPGEKKCEYILKMGEVLLKICRVLGEMVCKYRDQLLHTYLVGAKHADPQIRSSSLSNLGEACMHLKFNISGHWLQEILVCVLSLLKTDKDLEVRRCAVMVITLLLRGVGKDFLQVLETEIKDIYTQLKIVYHTESDDVLRLHSQLALEEINATMKELLTTKLPLTKEIRILQ